MKITILIQSVRPGGAERQAFETATELQALGVEVEVIGLSEATFLARKRGNFGREYRSVPSSTLAPARFYVMLRAAGLLRRLFQLLPASRNRSLVSDEASKSQPRGWSSPVGALAKVIVGSDHFGVLTGSAVANVFLKSPRVIIETRFLKAYFDKSRPDLIVSYLTGPNFVAILTGQILDIPVVISERNDLVAPWSSPDVQTLRKLLYPVANLITANAGFATRDLEKILGQGDVRWFPNHLAYRVGEAVPDGESRRNVCVICRLVPQKRVASVIEAMASDTLEDLGVDLLVFGSGAEQAELQKLAKRLGIEPRVRFFGYRKRDDIAGLLDGVGFIIVNSAFEGSSNSLHEAVQLGLIPIVASTVQEIDDIVSAELRGRIVTDGSPEAIAQLLEDLLASDEHYRETLQLVERDFLHYWERAARERNNIIDLIVRNPWC